MPTRKVMAGVLVALALTAIILWATWEPSLATWEMILRVEPARSSPPPYIPGVWFDPTAGRANQAQWVLLSSDRVILPAINDPEWVAARKDSPRDLERFRQRLTISPGKDPRLITIRFSDEDAEVARIVLEALVRSWRECLGDTMRRVPPVGGRDLRTRVKARLKAALETNDDPEIRNAYEQMLRDDEQVAASGDPVTIVSLRLVTD